MECVTVNRKAMRFFKQAQTQRERAALKAQLRDETQYFCPHCGEPVMRGEETRYWFHYGHQEVVCMDCWSFDCHSSYDGYIEQENVEYYKRSLEIVEAAGEEQRFLDEYYNCIEEHSDYDYFADEDSYHDDHGYDYDPLCYRDNGYSSYNYRKRFEDYSFYDAYEQCYSMTPTDYRRDGQRHQEYILRTKSEWENNCWQPFANDHFNNYDTDYAIEYSRLYGPDPRGRMDWWMEERTTYFNNESRIDYEATFLGIVPDSHKDQCHLMMGTIECTDNNGETSDNVLLFNNGRLHVPKGSTRFWEHEPFVNGDVMEAERWARSLA